MTFRTGESVRITCYGKTVTGEIFMASEDGLSLTLMFDEYPGGYRNFMAVLWVESCFLDLFSAEPVTIARWIGCS